MGNPPGPFEMNRGDVAAKVIDGELILIRLSDGTYYSMDNVGTLVWALLEGRHDLASTVQTIADWFSVPVERVRGDIDALVTQLLVERLVTVAGEPPGPPPAATRPADLLAYEAPRLNIYRDMGNLLALDPPTPGIDDLLFKNDRVE